MVRRQPRTSASVAYDDHQLYFAFDVRYSDPSIMRANRVDRDQASGDDLIMITVYLDTFLDQQRAYDFDVNGYGVQGDGVLTAGTGGGAIPRADGSWDTLFHTAAHLVGHGYTAEMAIPFSLRAIHDAAQATAPVRAANRSPRSHPRRPGPRRHRSAVVCILAAAADEPGRVCQAPVSVPILSSPRFGPSNLRATIRWSGTADGE